MTKKTYMIYLIVCIPEERGYIGQTCQRIEQRCRHGKRYKPGTKIREAFDRHTEDDFVCIVLEDGLTKEEADIKEQYWIQYLGTVWPNGYNLENGGVSSKKLHTETIQKLIDSNRNNPKQKCRAVKQYTKDGEFKAEYPSIHEASRRTGISIWQISSVAFKTPVKDKNGKYYIPKSAGGYLWKSI